MDSRWCAYREGTATLPYDVGDDRLFVHPRAIARDVLLCTPLSASDLCGGRARRPSPTLALRLVLGFILLFYVYLPHNKALVITDLSIKADTPC